MAKLGELQTAIIAAPAGIPNFAEVLVQADGAVLATPAGWDRIRIEQHLPLWGVDFQAGCFPQEASLEHLAVSFNKGCYTGQEAVFMLQKRGHVNKRLVRLQLDDAAELAAGAAITTPEGDTVGEVTSSVSDGANAYAMALVRYKHTPTGTRLKIGERDATVSCVSAREGC